MTQFGPDYPQDIAYPYWVTSTKTEFFGPMRTGRGFLTADDANRYANQMRDRGWIPSGRCVPVTLSTNEAAR